MRYINVMLQRVSAAIILFTRLPMWRLVQPAQCHYESAVVYWPIAGYITAGATAVLMYGLSFVLPPFVTAALALSGRLILTGALHEDGLADFCDGFGGGSDKERILAIMKDSHIGTYGVIGIAMYLLLTVGLLSALPVQVAALAIIAADPFSKLCAGQLTNILPYARPEGAKNKIAYHRMSALQLVSTILSGILPTLPLLWLSGIYYGLTFALPAIMLAWLAYVMHRRIGGYTGDCCGAAYLLCELSMLTGINIVYRLWNLC